MGGGSCLDGSFEALVDVPTIAWAFRGWDRVKEVLTARLLQMVKR